MDNKRRGSRRSRGSQALGGKWEGDDATSGTGLAVAAVVAGAVVVVLVVLVDLDVNECDGRRGLDISVGDDKDKTATGVRRLGEKRRGLGAHHRRRCMMQKQMTYCTAT